MYIFKLNIGMPLGSKVLAASKACVVENLDRNYDYRNICILSDSQAAIKALRNYRITTKLVWDYHQLLMQLAEHNRAQLI
jgi:hypothetical protein